MGLSDAEKKFINLYPYLRFVLDVDTDAVNFGIVLVCGSMVEAKGHLKKMIMTDRFIEIVNLKKIPCVCNYQGGIHIWNKMDSEAEILNFLGEKAFCPILLIDGLVPEYLEDTAFVINIGSKEASEPITEAATLFSWIKQNVALVVNTIRFVKTSRYLDTVVDQMEESLISCIAVGEVYKVYLRAEGEQEDEVETWMDRFVTDVIKMLENSQRMTGRYHVTEAVRLLLYNYIAECDYVNIFYEGDLYMLNREEITNGKYILISDEFIYLKEDMMREVCVPLLTSVSLRQLKVELFEEGTLLCQNIEKRNFTTKKLLYSADGKECRPRFLRLKKSAFTTAEGLDFEDYVKLLNEKEDKNNVTGIFI